MDDNFVDKINIDKLNEIHKKKRNSLPKNYYHEIIPNLFLGDLPKALESKNSFDIIINLSGYDYSVFNDAKIHKYIIDDNPFEDIIKIINETNEIIKTELENNKKILVHCYAGRSRSVSIIIGYLIKYHKMTYNEAEQLIKSKRLDNEININIGFIAQLKKYSLFL